MRSEKLTGVSSFNLTVILRLVMAVLAVALTGAGAVRRREAHWVCVLQDPASSSASALTLYRGDAVFADLQAAISSAIRQAAIANISATACDRTGPSVVKLIPTCTETNVHINFEVLNTTEQHNQALISHLTALFDTTCQQYFEAIRAEQDARFLKMMMIFGGIIGGAFALSALCWLTSFGVAYSEERAQIRARRAQNSADDRASLLGAARIEGAAAHGYGTAPAPAPVTEAATATSLSSSGACSRGLRLFAPRPTAVALARYIEGGDGIELASVALTATAKRAKP